MTDLMEVIKGRRSMRKYQDRQINQQDLDTLLEAIQWSPSWANTQCWEVIIIKEVETKQKIQDTLSATNPARKATVEAPVLICLCGKLRSSGYYDGKASTKFGDWFMFDCGLCTQNLCLTAHYLGLATVIVGDFDQDKVKGILQVPEGYDVVVLIPVGYPLKEKKGPPRREIEHFVHYETF